MQQLLIFDIDETLLRSQHDTACFVQAFEDAHGLSGFPVGMEFYASTTDEGIAREIWMAAHGRAATPAELRAVQARYCSLLEQRARQDPASVRQTPGAGPILRQLRAQPETRLALATGAWGSTAALKLRLADLDVHDLPAASSDDAASRVEIVELAIARAKRAYACAGFAVTVLIGDGPWDLEVAGQLGLGFIGIGAYVRTAGARWVFDDFTDSTGILSALDSFSRHGVERGG